MNIRGIRITGIVKHYTLIFNLISIIITIIIIEIAVVFYALNSFPTDITNHQFAYQTQSLIHGKVDIPQTIDTINIGRLHFWPENPFPSIFLIPGQLILGINFSESAGQLITIFVLIFFLYKLAKRMKFDRESSLWFVFAFLFSSIMVNLIIIPSSWYFAQVLATTILTILLYEFETRRRYLVLGLLEAALIATRPSAGFIGLLILGILIYIFYKKGLTKSSIKNFFLFLSPIIVSIVLLFYFNYIRFRNPFTSPYALTDPGPIFRASQKIGVISLLHIPSSVYYFFLAGPIPVLKDQVMLKFPYITYSPFGLSFFIVSPIFIFSFSTLKRTANYIREYWLVIAITVLLLLSFFSLGGFRTYGPRYMADVIPILYVLLLKSFKPPTLPFTPKFIILLSAVFNFFMILTPYFILLVK